MRKILDFGCGDGKFSNYLADRDKCARIYGLDISKSNIANAIKNSVSDRQSYFISDGSINFPDDYFDEIYCYEVLEHVKKLDHVLMEIKRVLKKEGRLFITVPSKTSEIELSRINEGYFKQIGHVRVLDKEKIYGILQDNGFRILIYKTYNSIEHLYLKRNFKRGIRITNQNGNTDKKPSLYWRMLMAALNQDRYYYEGSDSKRKMMKRRVISLVSSLFYPVSLVLDHYLTNKKQKIIVQREN